jgi:hypothetical protein
MDGRFDLPRPKGLGGVYAFFQDQDMLPNRNTCMIPICFPLRLRLRLLLTQFIAFELLDEIDEGA